MYLPRILFAMALCWGLVACGGGSSTTPTATPDNNTPTVEEKSDLYLSLTDAEGDFLTYEVDVTHLSLTRANGIEIDALPFETRVDFAQYVELSELLTLASVPVGRYDSASITLDFTDALITVQSEEGLALDASPLNAEGEPLGSIEVEIQFGDRDGFVMWPRRAAHLNLDFDLDASNTIDIEGDVATVTVSPVLMADAALHDPKPFRVRGLINEVYEDGSGLNVDLRPFRIRERRFGSMDVLVDDETIYELDGEILADGEGLRALAELELNSPVVALGEWDREDHSFTAREIRAGSSVPWGERDGVRATVVARDGNTLAVRGAIVEFSEGHSSFNEELNVLLGEETRVVKAHDAEVGLQDISVGSAIYVLGDMDDEGNIDATAGVVRIVSGAVSGTVVSASPLAVDLSLINGRRASTYNFAGTGTAGENDADPDYYEIATASLPLDSVELNDPVRLRGWVSDFGSAPEDFQAASIYHAGNVKGHFVIGYGLEGAASAIASLGDEGVLFDLAEAGERHHMVFAGIPIDLSNIAAGVPLLVPGADRGVYALSLDDRIVVTSEYSRFLELLELQLEEGKLVVRVDAHGYYNDTDNSFASNRLRVRLTNNEPDQNDQ